MGHRSISLAVDVLCSYKNGNEFQKDEGDQLFFDSSGIWLILRFSTQLLLQVYTEISEIFTSETSAGVIVSIVEPSAGNY